MKKLPILLGVAALLMASGGAGAWWVLRPDPAASAGQAAAAPPRDNVDYKYVSLDKVIVMLRPNGGTPMSHYLAVDLVFKTAPKQEPVTKAHLPLLRSLAVQRLAEHTLQSANNLTIGQLTTELNEAFNRSYAEEQREKPFASVLIGKLIIE